MKKRLQKIYLTVLGEVLEAWEKRAKMNWKTQNFSKITILHLNITRLNITFKDNISAVKVCLDRRNFPPLLILDYPTGQG